MVFNLFNHETMLIVMVGQREIIVNSGESLIPMGKFTNMRLNING